ncbi:hypothetical protein GQ53DRAFT_882264 [Thozetella sp. PMI_491]|nr:hypothetical protein GQ53DRAFT_882264 [Thozetella sp. PMI_491]
MTGTAESFTLLALALSVIGSRIGVRWKQAGPSNWELDDYVMPLTGAAFTAETVLAYAVGSQYGGLTNSFIDDEQRAALDPASEEYSHRVTGSKIQVAGWSLYAFILWSMKLSLVVFYARLTSRLAHPRLLIQISLVLLGVTYVAVALSLLLGCQPMSKYWQVYPDPGNLCQPAISKLNVFVVVIPNVVTDLFLLSIPLPLLWKVNISLRKKIHLMCLFSGAVFVVMAGTIRAVVILTAGSDGAISGSQWACRETFVSIVITNLPIIQPLIRAVADKVGLSALISKSSRQASSHPLGSKDRGTQAFELSKKDVDSKVLSKSQSSAWDSDEHILRQDTPKDTKQPSPTSNTKIIVRQDITIDYENTFYDDQPGRSSRQDWS